MIYSFILGKNPNLSLAEIMTVLGAQKADFRPIYIGEQVFLANFNKEVNLEALIKRLGGTVKIGQIILETEKDLNPEQLLSVFGLADKKVFFGFSFYNLGSESATFKNLWRQNKFFGMELKRILKEKYGASSRWVMSQDKTLSSVVVAKNKLLTQGKELNFFVDQDKIYLGETIAVQDFEEYGLLDFGRPNRDDKSGMLPPKLAKMMLNLSRTRADQIILDPFCGSGTIIQEAILMGYQKVVGSDNSAKAIEDTQVNLDWLKQKYPEKNIKAEIFVADAQKLSFKIESGSIDSIITEPYLGPAKFNNNQIDEIVFGLRDLYLASFEEFYKILKPGGRVVMVSPIWRIGNQLRYLPILDQVKKMGFTQIDFSKSNVEMDNQSRSGLIYQRESQKVIREIFVWEKK